jgi:hypothetical protein
MLMLVAGWMQRLVAELEEVVATMQVRYTERQSVGLWEDLKQPAEEVVLGQPSYDERDASLLSSRVYLLLLFAVVSVSVFVSVCEEAYNIRRDIICLNLFLLERAILGCLGDYLFYFLRHSFAVRFMESAYVREW